MITLTIIKRTTKAGQKVETRSLECINSIDKAKKKILPIVKEMEVASQTNKKPAIEIVAVSYDTNSEKEMLLATRAIVTSDNE